jgi:hypothetical protein
MSDHPAARKGARTAAVRRRPALTSAPAIADRDWWTAHFLIAIFCVLVAAILAMVPGWGAPLHAWNAVAACVLAALAVHAGARAALAAWRRCWREAACALLLVAGLGLAAAAWR